MTDIRTERLAELIVEYSVKVQPGERIAITGTTLSEPLMLALQSSVLKAGGHPHLIAAFPEADARLMREADDDQIAYVNPYLKMVIEEFDSFIQIASDGNTRRLSSVTPARQGLRARSMAPIYKRYSERLNAGELRILITLFPTQALAQEAEMSLGEFEDFVYAATFCDTPDPVLSWNRIHDEQQRLVDWLKGHQLVEVRGPNACLKLSIEGRDFLNADGTLNMPSGEIYTSPVEESVEGWVRFDYPCIYRGTVVTGVELTFEAGKVIEARAEKGESFLHQMLDVDEGARFVGEFAIGTNKRIDRFIGNMLFDEKMGDTIHMALGNGFSKIGGKNTSGIHWDMLSDMCDGGQIFVDGEQFYESGEFLI
ncbi:MAG: aminopeptidase [Anaerolineales bacterium]|nr:aminopeptidase [Anaerolineales bacterium]